MIRIINVLKSTLALRELSNFFFFFLLLFVRFCVILMLKFSCSEARSN